MLEMWLATKITAPVWGILSWPRQSRRVSGRIIRCSSETTAKIVPRPGSRLAWASDRNTVELDSAGLSAIHTSGSSAASLPRRGVIVGGFTPVPPGFRQVVVSGEVVSIDPALSVAPGEEAGVRQRGSIGV